MHAFNIIDTTWIDAKTLILKSSNNERNYSLCSNKRNILHLSYYKILLKIISSLFMSSNMSNAISLAVAQGFL